MGVNRGGENFFALKYISVDPYNRNKVESIPINFGFPAKTPTIGGFMPRGGQKCPLVGLPTPLRRHRSPRGASRRGRCADWFLRSCEEQPNATGIVGSLP